MSALVTPVNKEAAGKITPREGVGLALSGGGYRAMVFHLGALLRLFETGILGQLQRISSVSGGSITAAKLGLEWNRIHTREDLIAYVVDPVRKLASETIDAPSILSGLLLPGSVADKVSHAYARTLFGKATLQDLPDSPRFVINATNLETCSLFRFSKPYMADYRLGVSKDPRVLLADAVTASSAFPPVLSPFVLHSNRDDFSEPVSEDPDLYDEIALTDGGVYDNLGLETIWKSFQTVLVSDAGGKNAVDPTPPGDWARHAKRVIDVIQEQVGNMRMRQLISSYKAMPDDPSHRKGAYWGIGTDIAAYGLGANVLNAPYGRTLELAQTPTRLKRLTAEQQERLINWGYAVCDAALRAHYPVEGTSKPASLPYAGRGI